MKNLIKRTIHTAISIWDLDGADRDLAIKCITDWFDFGKSQGYSNIKLNIQGQYESADLELVGERLETDREYAARLKKEQKSAVIAEQRHEKQKQKLIEKAKKLGMKFV